jgi:hypothetical protein
MARMTGQETLAEIEYLLTFREHPASIAKALGRTPEGIYRMAWRAGNTNVSDVFSAEVTFRKYNRIGGTP